VIEHAARGYAKIIGQKTKYDIESITAVDPERDLASQWGHPLKGTCQEKKVFLR